MLLNVMISLVASCAAIAYVLMTAAFVIDVLTD